MTLDAVNLPLLAVGLALTVLSVTALVVLRRRRHAAKPAAVDCDIAELVDQADGAELVAVTEMLELLALNGGEDDHESVTVRSLRAQVRTLEQALEVAPETSPVPAVVGSAVDQSYRHQVLLAVRAVAARADVDDDPRHAAARVVAAVERLEEVGFTRPALPGIGSRSIAVPPPPPLPPAEPAAVAPTPAPPVLPAPDVETVEVVLPVPPPAPEEPKRTRRRLRRSAA